MPRIITGTARGTRLLAPPGDKTRPTGDKVKEALFSILAPRMPADGFLDLYAGTGQIGLEAASRGAARVVLVENAPPALAAIRANAAKTRLEEKTEIIAAGAAAALQVLHGRPQLFDIIYMDPPYAEAITALLQLSAGLASLLDPDGALVLEHQSNEEPPVFVTNLQLYRSCQYGTAMLSFYKVDQSVKGE